MKTLYRLVLSYTILAACRHPEPIPLGPWDDAISNDSIIKEIPVFKKTYFTGKPNLFYTDKYYDAKGLGLDSLESGYNSFQLRVWLGHSLAIVRNVVIIYKTRQQWHATIIAYRSPTKAEFDAVKPKKPLRIALKKWETVPASGWTAFIKKILELQILNLPNADDITGYNGCGTDGIDYDFEIATRNKYRFFYYCNPEDNAERYWQAKNVLIFAGLLEKEFGFTYDK